jgi:hypothetical protein
VKYGQEWEAALRKMLAKTAEERGTFESLLALIPAEIEMNIIQTCE